MTRFKFSTSIQQEFTVQSILEKTRELESLQANRSLKARKEMLDRKKIFQVPKFSDNIDTSMIKTKEDVNENEKTLEIKKQLQTYEFYGLPLKKMKPVDSSQAHLKLKKMQKLTNITLKDILSFYSENNSVYDQKAYVITLSMVKNKINNKDDVKLSSNQNLKKFIFDSKIFFTQDQITEDEYENFSKTIKHFIQIYQIINQKQETKEIEKKDAWIKNLPTNILKCYQIILKDEQFLTAKASQDCLINLMQTTCQNQLLDQSVSDTYSKLSSLSKILCERNQLQMLTPKNIYDILVSFKTFKISRNEKVDYDLYNEYEDQLFYRLEPYIIKYFFTWNDQKAFSIAQFYFKNNIGTQQFLQQIIALAAKYCEDQNLQNLYSQSSNIQNLVGSLPLKYDLYNNLLMENIKLSMPIFSKKIITNMQNLKPKQYLQKILDRMIFFQVGNRSFYEILSVEFVKNVNDFSFKQKCSILQSLAKADIDANNIFKTVHTICASTFEVFFIQNKEANVTYKLENLDKILQQIGQNKEFLLPEGIYSDFQEKQIRASFKDLEDSNQVNIQNIKSLLEIKQQKKDAVVYEQEKQQKYQEILQVECQRRKEQLECMIKLSWAFMVFSSQDMSTNRSSQSIDSNILGENNLRTQSYKVSFNQEEKAMAYDSRTWQNIIQVIQQHLQGLSDINNQITDEQNMKLMNKEVFEMMNQLKCHVLLHGNKLGLQQPFKQEYPNKIFEIKQNYFKRSLEYNNFINEAVKQLELFNVYSSNIYDFYEVVGEQRSEVEEGSLVKLIHLNPPERYFRDIKEYDSWVRIRDDHLQMLMRLDNKKFDQIKKNQRIDYNHYLMLQQQEAKTYFQDVCKNNLFIIQDKYI